jgi:hypothetical protein
LQDGKAFVDGRMDVLAGDRAARTDIEIHDEAGAGVLVSADSDDRAFACYRVLVNLASLKHGQSISQRESPVQTTFAIVFVSLVSEFRVSSWLPWKIQTDSNDAGDTMS